jgi:primosomal protein N'
LDKLQNSNIHRYVIEEMRRKLNEMKKMRWKITLRRFKAHAGIWGNELADKLAKKAATKENFTESYKRVPKSVVLRELEGEGVRKWQREWTRTAKGRTTKEFFPDLAERIKMKINFTQNFTTIVTGHGKTRAYLHRFKIVENQHAPVAKRTRQQTT